MHNLLVNAGSGPEGGGRVPSMFSGWRHLRVDADPAVNPDVVADITEMSRIPDESADAVWSAHCIEHLYMHDVARALGEFRRILKGDGFACIIVPDLQTVANSVAADRLSEVLYESPAGPVTAHDVIFGFGVALSRGHVHMAHRCGFTPTVLTEKLREAGFEAFVIRRRPATLELAAVARKQPWPEASEREALLQQLNL